MYEWHNVGRDVSVKKGSGYKQPKQFVVRIKPRHIHIVSGPSHSIMYDNVMRNYATALDRQHHATYNSQYVFMAPYGFGTLVICILHAFCPETHSNVVKQGLYIGQTLNLMTY